MISSIRLKKALIFCIFLLVSAVKVEASETPLSVTAKEQQWMFLPDIGLEGQAYITDGGSYRLDVECGNGGGPSVMVISPELFNTISTVIPDQTNLDFIIDNTVYSEAFTCIPTRESCGSFGFPSAKMMTAMRHGNRLLLQYDNAVLTEFSLVGSKAALSRLSACL